MSRMSLNIAQTHEIETSYTLFPATPSQVRFWHEQSVSPQASALNVAFRLKLAGPLDARMIENVLKRLIDRHEILRTGFLMTHEGLRQQVWSRVAFTLGVVDLSILDDQDAQALAQKTGQEEARTPFDLSGRSFFRAVWLPRSAQEGELLLTFHSLVMDGWSFAIVVRELVDGLAALGAGRDPGFAEVELHHGDYTLWKEQFLADPAMEASRSYWRQELKDFTRFDVSGDRPRPAQRRHRGVIRSVLLPTDLTDRLTATAKAQGVTMFSLAAAGLAAALHKSTGQQQVAFGTQMSARDQQELEGVLGPLVNTVLLRLDISRARTLADLATQCSAKLSNAIAHVHLPFEEMIGMAGDVPDPARPPLCSVNFALQQSFVGLGDEVRKDDIAATTLPSFNAGALYDLSFFMVRRPDGWRISCEGDTDLFDVETIDRHIARWREELEAAEIGEAQPAAPDLAPRPAEAVPATARGVGSSGFMSQAELEAKARNIVRFNEGAPGTPVIALNNTAVFYGLSQQIGTDRPFIDIPMVPEGGPRVFPPRAFEDVAADAVRLIRLAQPKGPYILMGLCVLGSLGLEAAHQLRREGETVELVILNDSWCPGYRESMPWYDRKLRKLQVRLDNIPRDFRKAVRGETSMVKYLKQYRLIRWLRIADIALKLRLIKGDSSEHMIAENRWYTDYLLEQQVRYRPATYDGEVQIFRSAQALKGRLFAHELGWKSVVAGNLVVTGVPAMHDEMFRTVGSAVIGKQLRERLATIRADKN
jgi:thioesterase domain-containing protein